MIKNKITLVLCTTLISICTFSQNAKEKSMKQKVQTDFARFTTDDMPYLVPFQDADCKKYGYIDARTKEMVLTAEYNELSLYDFPYTSATYNDIVFIVRADSTKRLTVGTGVLLAELEEHKVIIAEKPKNSSLPQGFTLSPNTNHNTLAVDEHSAIYRFVEYPFILNKKYYAIAYKDGRYGIIDTDGEIHPNFDFQYTVLKINGLPIQKLSPSPQELWFYTKDVNNEEKFISTSGNIKMIGKNLANTETLHYRYSNRPRHTFGYALHANGVLDLVYMQWQIPPREGVEIVDIEYTSNQHYLNKQKTENRTMANIYFKAKNRKQIYYIDNNGYEYIK